MVSNGPLVLGIGEILWDLFPEGKILGGAPANCVFHARELGARATMLSCVGRDALGKEIVEELQRRGQDAQGIALSDAYPTGTVGVQLDAGGKPTYVIHENAAWDHLPQTPGFEALARRADAVCFGSLAQRSPESRRTIHKLLALTRPNCLRVIDVNLRQRYYSAEVLRDSFEAAEVLKLSDEELPIVAGALGIGGNAHAQMRGLLRDYDLRWLAVTQGAKGSLLVGRYEVYDCPGSSVEVADTVGAGDAFTAALTVGLLRGLAPERVNAAACAVAAFVCTQSGATPHLPEEVVKPLLDS